MAGDQSEDIGGSHTRTVTGGTAIRIGGSLDEQVGAGVYTWQVNGQGTTIAVGGQLTERVSGGLTRSIVGAGNDTVVGGYGMTSGGPISLTAAGPLKLSAGIADLSLSVFSVDAFLGNVSLNTKLGIMQLGGLLAFSPLVLGDGLAIHFTMLSQFMKLVNPLTLAGMVPGSTCGLRSRRCSTCPTSRS